MQSVYLNHGQTYYTCSDVTVQATITPLSSAEEHALQQKEHALLHKEHA